MNRKLVACLLAILMVVGLLSACTSTNQPEPTTTTPVDTAGEESTPSTPRVNRKKRV
jgi:predicted component of type VI protein secretion system